MGLRQVAPFVLLTPVVITIVSVPVIMTSVIVPVIVPMVVSVIVPVAVPVVMMIAMSAMVIRGTVTTFVASIIICHKISPFSFKI